ncbi:MtaA/CmuA family methyltransferase [Tissierella creatinini]|nr:MtaA/CmuA family methyltransferase [Tissierella creatinini]TJX64586.1 MtaA/CmuA family methyltransferase [Soehngenia saccharolytica]
MNSKERLLNTLKGNSVDRIPCICPGGMMNMVITELMHKTGIMWPDAHLDGQKMADLAAGVYEYGMFENYGVPFCMTIEVESIGGGKIDMGNEKFEPHVVEYVIGSVSDYKQLNKTDINSGRAKVTIDAIKLLKQKDDGVPIIGNLSGPVSVASSIMDPVKYYKELRRNKEDAHGFMEFVTDQIIHFGQAQIKAGADVIAISDPSGTGEIMGPKYFEEYAVKYLNKLIDGLREVDRTIPVIVHICGQMHSVYEELKHLKADAFSFDAIVGIKDVREHLGQDKILMGNVSSFALETSNPQKIQTMAQSAINNGVNILSPACGLGTQSSMDNIKALLETVKNQG